MRYPPNSDPNVVGFYLSHEPSDRPPMPSGVSGTVMFNNLFFGSFHPAGCNWARGDASVYFMSDSIDLRLYAALGSRNGEEVVSEQ